jgi:hypothetical protein
MRTPFAFIVALLLMSVSLPVQAATCRGAVNCRACKTCEYCKNCNNGGQKCGVYKRIHASGATPHGIGAKTPVGAKLAGKKYEALTCCK